MPWFLQTTPLHPHLLALPLQHPLPTLLKILGFWCVGFSEQLTARLVNLPRGVVREWFGMVQEVCRVKLLLYGVPAYNYTPQQVEVIAFIQIEIHYTFYNHGLHIFLTIV